MSPVRSRSPALSGTSAERSTCAYLPASGSAAKRAFTSGNYRDGESHAASPLPQPSDKVLRILRIARSRPFVGPSRRTGSAAGAGRGDAAQAFAICGETVRQRQRGAARAGLSPASTLRARGGHDRWTGLLPRGARIGRKPRQVRPAGRRVAGPRPSAARGSDGPRPDRRGGGAGVLALHQGELHQQDEPGDGRAHAASALRDPPGIGVRAAGRTHRVHRDGRLGLSLRYTLPPPGGH